MKTKLNLMANLVQRLSGHLRYRASRRLLRVLLQNDEWCRQAREAPPLSESIHRRVR